MCKIYRYAALNFQFQFLFIAEKNETIESSICQYKLEFYFSFYKLLLNNKVLKLLSIQNNV